MKYSIVSISVLTFLAFGVNAQDKANRELIRVTPDKITLVKPGTIYTLKLVPHDKPKKIAPDGPQTGMPDTKLPVAPALGFQEINLNSQMPYMAGGEALLAVENVKLVFPDEKLYLFPGGSSSILICYFHVTGPSQFLITINLSSGQKRTYNI